ncbi:glycosyltransferase family 4 protein [Rhizobium sp. SL86]|uniref:glycosyltransferase family 4 protein n=1 Tax=Rhizobium sp. SL86 TaxID=2995148 RepID=UPI0022727E39|nr:glycosyltransferase family 1 protein [Rhizobium sp. SL86]MCY1669377.1 glycosyltransferase family 1 protein [Rhizobium sp. SL86]
MNSADETPKVMIDGFNLGLSRGTGVATYARNLSFACHQSGYSTGILYGSPVRRRTRSDLMTEVSFFDVEQPLNTSQEFLRDLARLIPHPGGYRPFRVPISGEVVTRALASRLPHFDSLWNVPDLYPSADYQFALTGRFHKVMNVSKTQIMHWTYPLPLKMRGARNVYTLHDLVPLRLPYATLDRKSSYLKLVNRCVREADVIATVSETSRSDIIRILNCDPDKVVNTYQAVSLPVALVQMDDAEVQAKVEGIFGLKHKGYFLFFGAIEPKKNVGRLTEAFLTSNVSSQLAIVGPTGWQSDQELRFFNDMAQRQLKKTGPFPTADQKLFRFEFVPLALLIALIKGARATIFPSLIEGFGLPILESMLLGTPVITSKGGATEEIAGDAALLVDPYNTLEIASAIQKIDGDGELRQKLGALGQQRATLFSPERYHERLQALYQPLLAGL